MTKPNDFEHYFEATIRLGREANELRAENERLNDDNARLAECWTIEQEAHTQTSDTVRLLQEQVERLRASQSDLYEALRGFFEADFSEDLKPYFDAARAAMARADTLR